MFHSKLGFKIDTSFGSVFELNNVEHQHFGINAALVRGCFDATKSGRKFGLMHFVLTIHMQIV